MSKDFEYDPETGSFRFDESGGKTKKKNDVDVGGWIIIAALFPVGTLCYWTWQGANTATLVFVTVCAAFMGGMVIWLHRSNIQRLKNGTEYRFGSKNPQK